MAKSIGVVSKVVGQVFVVEADGSRRLLVEGDRLFVGEQLETGAAGAVAVHLANGEELTLGRDSSLTLSNALLANQAPHVLAPEVITPSEAQLTDVEKLQQAIAAGGDPTLEAEATAAGPGNGAPGALGGGHSFVLLTEVAGRVDPVIGFPTAGFNFFGELANRDPGLIDHNEALPALDNPISLEGLSVAGGEVTVNEANLPQGSASDGAALVQTGTFSVVAADGVFNLNVGGINVLTSGAVTGVGQSVTTPTGNVLTITGYDPATGVVSYSYTLTTAGSSLGESITVSASDSNGDVTSGSLDVTIVDDVPRAVDDTHPSVASEASTVLTGNVLPNDIQGADRVANPIVPGTFVGTYGTLVLASDGSYTYTLNSSDPDFVNLHGGGKGSETFTYTLTDADGDTSTANLVLNITNLDDGVNFGGIGANGGILSVYEKNLSTGSSPDTAALTQSGSFTVSAADGLQSLSVGGINVITGGVAITSPQSVVTPLGNTLTVTSYDPNTGVVTYSYTLLENETHPAGGATNSLGESFSVVATDTDGSASSINLNVLIVDDVPTAVADSNASVATEAATVLTGNVLTNDVQGADRVVGPITAGTFVGTYGTLVLAADGSYTYTLNPADPDFFNLHGGGTGVETFAYTLTDADGDTSTANLVLNITNLNDPVVLTGLDASGGEISVLERNLATGSSPDAAALTQSGSFTVNAPDGLQTLSVGGINVIAGGVAASFPQSVTTPLGNTLTVTGYNPSTGVVSYSYTLLDSEAHASAGGVNSLTESFTVTATDTDGSTSSGNLDVNIVDDVPAAVADSNASVATEAATVLTGNVLTNDVQGADRVVGPITAGTFVGTYGTLVLAADGSYTYTLNPADPDFFNLHGGGTGIETFAYTLTDADGDTSTANLVLNITNLNDPVTLAGLDTEGGELSIYEKSLGDGSAPNAGALTQSSTFTVTAPDGLQTLSVGGINVISGGVAATFPQSVTTPLGNTLTVTGYNPSTGVVSYSYTLVDNEAHANAGGINSLTESFTVTATDTDGSTTSGSLDVNIVDDVPTAVADSNASVATEAATVLTGNVLTNDVQGADRVVGPITAGTFVGTYGTLVLAADGSYTYTLNPADPDFFNLHGGGTGVETFAYTLTDADGDTSTANLVLNITNLNDPVTLAGLDTEGGELSIYEKNLGDGSAPNAGALTQSNTFTVTAPDGLQTLSVGGISVISGGVAATFPQSVTTPLGNTLTVTGYNPSTGVVSYSYTLLDNEAHANAGGVNSLTESFTVTATDTDGSTSSGSLDVNVVDDVPTAVADSNASVATEAATVLTGNVLTNDVQGADRVVGPITAGTFVGTYGTLVLAADGSYTYTLNPADPDFFNLHGGGTGVETFAYTLTDADGDTSTANLVLDIKNLNDPVSLSGLDTEGGELSIYEKNLGDGSAPNAGALTQSNTFTVTAPDGLQTLSVGSINVISGGVVATFPQTLTTPLGNTLTVTGYNPSTGVVSYSYTLLDNEAHANAGGINSLTESFTVTATDTDGSTTSGSLDVNIVDDVPTAVADSNASVATEAATVLTGNVLTNDVQGADRVVGPITAGTFVGTYGTLVLAADGSYTYTLNPADPDFFNLYGGGTGIETFAYTLTDADGDTSTANLVLDIKNLNDPVTLTGIDTEGGELSIYEKNLGDGSAPNAGALTQSNTFTVTAPDGLQTLSVGGISVISGGVAATFPQSVTTPLGNTLTVTGYNPSTGVVSYSYTLLDNEAHANAGGVNSLTESFTVTATDTDGSTSSGSLDVNVVDDVPTAVADSNASVATEAATVLTGNVLTNDVQGADRVVGPITAGTFVGTYGTLVLAADGSYTYTLNPADPDFFNLHGGGTGIETFAYTLTDADGDASTANLVLDIKNLNDPVVLTGLDASGGELSVYEKNLGDGSSPNAGALTQSGSFSVSAPDGLQTLSVGGISVISGGVAATFPQSVTTPLGNTLTVTGYNPSTGVVSYSYTLLDNEAHANAGGINSLTESFTVTATDTDGSTTSGSLDVNIVDDVPTAVADSNASVATEVATVLTGNVLTNDVQGADRVVGPITAGTFVGTYGTLVLAADGSYTYTLNPADPDFSNLHGGGTGTETFAYTLTDADGDTSTANLVLNIKNLDDSITLTGLDTAGGELSVYEKNLSDGSAPNAGALTQSGTFTVTAPDGLQTLSVGGINVISGGVANSFPQSTTTLLGNTLTVTGYNPSTGVVSYSYTLLDNEAHANAGGINSLTESFTVTATDTDGSTTSGSLDVNVVDDVPTAVADSNASVATEAATVLTGNVLTNDVQGADRVVGPITAGTFVGTYGTLVLAADGSYTYTLNPADPDFFNLHGGGTGTETFAYTLKDADGDTSTANLVLNIKNLNDPVTLNGLDTAGGELSVYEKNLSDGSAPNTGALTQSSTFTVTAPDGLQTLSVGGINVISGGVVATFPQTLTTPLGNTLTVTGYNSSTGVVSYSYTLLDNEAHANAGGINSLTESFTVTATDTDGSTSSGSLDVNVVDDVPTAVADSNASVATEAATVLTGNVLTNDVQGADRVVGPITAGTFVGTYGTLVLAADGSYTYTLNPADQDFFNLHGGGTGTETFAYTLKDGDGDTSTANLVLNIKNLNDPVTLNGLNVAGGELSVYEKNLSDGSAPNAGALTQSSTFTVTAPDGLQTLSVGGINVISGGVVATFPQTLTTPLGNTLTVTGYNSSTGVVSYSYTLLDNEAHANAGGINSLTESFTVTATDTDGSTTSGSLDVNVVDDVPTAVADSNASVATEAATVLTGNVLTNDVQGADRVVGPITAGTFVGTYGTLVLAADGSYTYTLNPADSDFINLHGGGTGTETFVYTLKDADGDTSTANLVLNIKNLNDPVTLNGLNVAGGELSVYEKNLSDGSAPNAGALTQSGTFTVTAPDGLQTLSVGGINVISGGVVATFPQTLTTPLGNTLTVTGYNSSTGVVSYSYTLLDNEAHANAGGINSLTESFTVTATDTDGSTSSGSLDVNVVDDVPTAVADSNASVATEAATVLTGNVLTNDVQGADRVVGPITAGTFVGTYGTLVLAADGSYTYTLNPADPDFINLHGGGTGTETFAYTLKDADGDTSTANLVLNIKNLNDPVTLNGLNVAGGELSVYEKNLSDGSAPNAGALTQSGTFTVTAPDGLQTLSVGGINVISGGVVATFPQTLTTPLGNTLKVTGYNPSTGVVSYSYTLLDNEAHPNAGGINSLTESFTVTATDADGSTNSGTLDVNIVDDVPTARADSIMVTEGDTVTGNVLGNDTKGADDPGSNVVVGVRAGANTSTSAIGSLNTNVAGTYGTLTLDAAGNAVYHANPNAVAAAGAQDVFTYTIRDADGDESTTTLTVNVKDCSLIAGQDQDITVYEKALDLSKDGQDLAAGTVVGSEPGNTGETGSGTLVGSVSGGSGAITYSLVGSSTGSYGQIQLLADGSYKYTLTSAPKTPSGANDGANVMSESFTYKATDALGNFTTSTIQINIVDDVPKAVGATRSVTPGQVDSNLLLVIDVSGSMNDDSGVPGLTRLQLAKQAISALLDKYDDLGDVKVQIVTFSSGATGQSAVWVTVDQAKTIVNGLSAGGSTYYDSATTQAQTAFSTAGKITGAQNITYFFSDGEPTSGHAISGTRETTWTNFLDSNGIKSYAIGLGSGVNAGNLNPLAYDGSTHTDTNATVVTDLNQLNSVLSGTVQGAPVTGSLMSGGTFGADGGFIKSLAIDGTTYTYDPKGNANQGSYAASGGTDRGTFDTSTNSITVKTLAGGSIVVDMDTGEFTYTPPKDNGTSKVENIGFVVSDNDGDLSNASLVVNVYTNAAPVAGADHVITNILSANITVPAEALVANDTDANNDRLSASPITFNTGWAARGADFTVGSSTPTVVFNGTNNILANQVKDIARSAFTGTASSTTAAVIVAGYLGSVTSANANDEDLITVTLKQGESLKLDHDRPVGNVLMEWKDDTGSYQTIADGSSFVASHDGVYSIHVVNLTNSSGGGSANNAENYQLTMTIDYAGAANSTPQYNGSYTVTDGHGGTTTGAVDINYQDSSTLTGTANADTLLGGSGNDTLNAGDGNDVLIGGDGNDSLYGGNGNDLLIGGPGNDLLDGGSGIDTASYASATSAVTVNLSIAAQQNTGGAGLDTLVSIENLIGSDYNDTLTGDGNANVLQGGLGNDILNGAGGDDVLIGGRGDDTLTGGPGADTFLWQLGDNGHDVVTDFTPGTDRLDLSQLLQGENASTASLDDYLHFKVTGSGASVVSTIEVSSVAGAAPTQTIDLAGVDLAQHYGVTAGAGGVIAAGADTATIINGMLNDQSLKVDTV
ncbi:retention module-containing protein [Pseudomonas sp. zfem002]|uniref:retention module-containing protein n=1 Tax=Pseudomonas sp. zfem002 TaxID=3078197 RepID=UPI00292A3B39|nr:retention module-containing protein [Pseudomonas sp. zfem002]MDU9389077.1 retention module-containing protein [Pseudomonas sp. zfem002]